MPIRTWGLVAIVVLGVVVAVLLLRPAPVPRILDEHGNNLVYQCPGDPRCTPSSPR